MPAKQIALLEQVAAANQNVVVVLSNGSVVSVAPWAKNAKGILESCLLGQAGGPALADVIFGQVSPSGKLAQSIPLDISDDPSTLNWPGEEGHVDYGEGVFVGYRYYDTYGKVVDYPFGYGLSYATFEIDDVAAAKTGANTATVTATVTNTSDVDAAETVQVYVAPGKADVARPKHELKGFTKVFLKAGESKTVTIDLDERAFAYWSEKYNDWHVEAGEYAIEVGVSSRDIADTVAVALDGDGKTQPLTEWSTYGEWEADPFGAKIVAAVKAGTLSEAALDKAVIRILNIVFRAADEAAAPAPELDLKGDHTIAAELAKECAVLLQNRGVLPLKKGSKVVYIGGFAKTPRYQGGGSSHINTIRVDSALEMAESHGRRVSYVEGFPADLDQREEEEFLRAVSAAAEADAAVIFAGLPESFESEGFDRSHMRLPESQNNLIARVAAVQKNTVVVLHTGSPVECPWANDVNAVLCMYLGGEGVGAAADALLWGDANPSGRLPETWPLRLEDTPCYLDFPGDGRHVEYREGVYVGYRWYDARKMPVLWPFGHGLSYTGFVYRNAQLTADEFAEGDSVRVRVSVKNVGMMPGKEVVQLYVADCTGTTGRPPKELRKFVKVKLEPGEEKQVEFTLTAQDLSYYDETLGSWYAAPGEYKILLGHSSRDIHATLSVRFNTPRRRPFVIDENTTIGELSKDDRTAAIIQQVLAQAGNALTGGNAGGSEIASSEAVAQMLDSMPLRGIVNFGGPAAAGMITPLLEILRAAIQ